ncbi:MAG: nuclear transport factor 2 family protein [Planctomycetota bacterium]
MSTVDLDQAVRDYFEATRSMDAERWAECFALDAMVDDPVEGPTMVGRKALLERGQRFAANFKTIGLHETFFHVAGQEAAAKWEARGTFTDGRDVTFEGINHFLFNADGKIARLQGFWDADALKP